MFCSYANQHRPRTGALLSWPPTAVHAVCLPSRVREWKVRGVTLPARFYPGTPATMARAQQRQRLRPDSCGAPRTLLVRRPRAAGHCTADMRRHTLGPPWGGVGWAHASTLRPTQQGKIHGAHGTRGTVALAADGGGEGRRRTSNWILLAPCRWQHPVEGAPAASVQDCARGSPSCPAVELVHSFPDVALTLLCTGDCALAVGS